MDFAEQLRILQAAQGNPALLALAAVDLAHSTLPETERRQIKDALLAAAVPHWCDSDFLAALLETTRQEADVLLGRLSVLTVVEPFPARGEAALNVHEAARKALREHLHTRDFTRWQKFSSRARSYLSNSKEPHSQIEALYHHFAFDQPAAAVACEQLDRELAKQGPTETSHALSLALLELIQEGWLSGTAQVEALISMLNVRSSRGEASQIETEARAVVDLARSASGPSGIGRAQCLLGEVLVAKGCLEDALAAYHDAHNIFLRLAEANPADVECQYDVTTALFGIGDIAQAQGRADDARAAFLQDLGISQRLANMDPANTAWQRSIAISQGRIGTLAREQGRFDDALVAYSEVLAISQRLAAMDPSNISRQRDLSAAYGCVGDIAQAQGRIDDALAAFRECLEICNRSATRDPTNAFYQRELAIAHSKVADMNLAKGHLEEALHGFRQRFAISQHLNSIDPSNAEWQRGLAIANLNLGNLFQRMGLSAKAQSSIRWGVKIMTKAVEMSPKNKGWQKELDDFKRLLR